MTSCVIRELRIFVFAEIGDVHFNIKIRNNFIEILYSGKFFFLFFFFFFILFVQIMGDSVFKKKAGIDETTFCSRCTNSPVSIRNFNIMSYGFKF